VNGSVEAVLGAVDFDSGEVSEADFSFDGEVPVFGSGVVGVVEVGVVGVVGVVEVGVVGVVLGVVGVVGVVGVEP
jgi:hypothetical protein